MASSVLQLPAARESTPLRVRVRRTFYAARSVLPRRWVIPWEMSANGRYWSRVIAEAKARKESRDEIMGLEAGEAHDYWELEEELEMIESGRLLKQAGKYMLATLEFQASDPEDPDSDPNWRRGTTFKPHWYLKRHAMEELRRKIRTEHKARVEPIGELVKIVGGAMGGLGGAWYLFKELTAFLSR